MRFEWDQRKAKDNLRKHGVSFEEARTAFRDPYAVLNFDHEHSDSEDRFILYGYSSRGRRLYVCHCYRGHDAVRIISARRASF